MKASRDAQSPFAVRYANSAEIPSIRDKFYPNGNFSAVGAVADFEKGNTPRLVFVTYGNITAKVIEAQAMLHSDGYDAGIVLVEKLCPYGDSVRMLSEYLCGAERVLFVEEGILNGGYSMITVNKLTSSYPELNGIAFDIAAIDESFAVPDTRCDIYEYLGLSPRALYERMKKQIGDTV